MPEPSPPALPPLPARRRWRRRRAMRRHRRRLGVGRRGFTLVEQLVALTMLGVGLLTLAAGGVELQRRATHALVHGDAALRAAARLERLAATPCTALADGGDAAAGERWSVAGTGWTRLVRYEVDHPGIGGTSATATRRYAATVRCLP